MTCGGQCALLHPPLLTCFPTLPPIDFKFSTSWLSNSLYVCVQGFCLVCNKGQVVAVSLAWLPVLCERLHLIAVVFIEIYGNSS